MTATSQPTLDTLPTMRDVAAVIAEDARENLAGVDVVSIDPLCAEQVEGETHYCVVAIVPDRDGKGYVPKHILLGAGPNLALAYVNRAALIFAFGTELATPRHLIVYVPHE
jgi:hypothetical protein